MNAFRSIVLWRQAHFSRMVCFLQFESAMVAGQTEKERQLKILNDMHKKSPKMNVTKVRALLLCVAGAF